MFSKQNNTVPTSSLKVRNWFQIGLKTDPKNDPKTVKKMSKNGPKEFQNRSKRGPKEVQKRPKRGPKWSKMTQNGLK